jgi:hypothetical protein
MTTMTPLTIFVLVLLIFGVVGGYGYTRHGGIGLGSAMVLMALIAALVWLAGGLGTGIR